MRGDDLQAWIFVECALEDEVLASVRAGFKSPLPEYAPLIKRLKVIKTDWEKTSTADLQKSRQKWVGNFNP